MRLRFSTVTSSGNLFFAVRYGINPVPRSQRHAAINRRELTRNEIFPFGTNEREKKKGKKEKRVILVGKLDYTLAY